MTRAGFGEYADAVVDAIGDRTDEPSLVPRRPIDGRVHRALVV